jgi:hypothetical protein
MAKLNRESRLREKRAEKKARKAERRLTAAGDAAEAASGWEERETSLDEAGAGDPGGVERAQPVSAATRSSDDQQ